MVRGATGPTGVPPPGGPAGTREPRAARELGRPGSAGLLARAAPGTPVGIRLNVNKKD